MRRTLLLPSAFLLVAALVAGCGDDDDAAGDSSTPPPSSTEPPAGNTTAPPSGGSLDGKTFLSRSVTKGGTDRPLVDGTQITLTFKDGTIGATAGCNQFGGDYTLDGDGLIVTGGAMTEMGCDKPRMKQDEWLFGLLGARPTVTTEGDQVTLTAGNTVIVLQDEETANPDRSLTGVRWTLESVIEGSGDDGTASSVGVDAWIEFGEDGKINANLGCNTGRGEYTVEGDQLTVGPIARTRMACPGEGDRVEAAMTKVLEAAPTFTIDAATLSLRTDASGLDFLAAK